jgi:hypothetical protein
LGPKNTSSIVGAQDHMQEVDMTHTIQIGIWTRSSGAIRILGTQSGCSNDYDHDRMRRSTGEVESIDDHGGR